MLEVNVRKLSIEKCVFVLQSKSLVSHTCKSETINFLVSRASNICIVYNQVHGGERVSGIDERVEKVLAPEICWTNRAKNGGTVGEGPILGLALIC
jgi:hypothetical protein